jgi:hypothetical protein
MRLLASPFGLAIIVYFASERKLIIAYAEKKAMSLCQYVCMYVTLHSLGVLQQISDFMDLKIRQKICGATRTKIISLHTDRQAGRQADRQTK